MEGYVNVKTEDFIKMVHEYENVYIRLKMLHDRYAKKTVLFDYKDIEEIMGWDYEYKPASDSNQKKM